LRRPQTFHQAVVPKMAFWSRKVVSVSAAVHALSVAVCDAIERQAAAAGLQTGLPLSPGMKGWAVDPGQHEIFSLIDPAEVGVTVMPTLEMHPLKSVTVVIGVGAEIAIKGAICDYCPLDDTCRHKIANRVARGRNSRAEAEYLRCSHRGITFRRQESKKGFEGTQ